MHHFSSEESQLQSEVWVSLGLIGRCKRQFDFWLLSVRFDRMMGTRVNETYSLQIKFKMTYEFDDLD